MSLLHFETHLSESEPKSTDSGLGVDCGTKNHSAPKSPPFQASEPELQVQPECLTIFSTEMWTPVCRLKHWNLLLQVVGGGCWYFGGGSAMYTWITNWDGLAFLTLKFCNSVLLSACWWGGEIWKWNLFYFCMEWWWRQIRDCHLVAIAGILCWQRHLTLELRCHLPWAGNSVLKINLAGLVWLAGVEGRTMYWTSLFSLLHPNHTV